MSDVKDLSGVLNYLQPGQAYEGPEKAIRESEFTPRVGKSFPIHDCSSGEKQRG